MELFDGGEEAVAAAGEGLDEAGVGCGVSEGLADAVDGGVETVLVVDEGSVGPEGAADFLAGEEVAGPVEEQEQDLEGLSVELDADSLAAELAGDAVCLKSGEAVAASWDGLGHGWLKCTG